MDLLGGHSTFMLHADKKHFRPVPQNNFSFLDCAMQPSADYRGIRVLRTRHGSTIMSPATSQSVRFLSSGHMSMHVYQDLPAYSFASAGIRVPDELGFNHCLITRISGVGLCIPHMGLDDPSAPPTSIAFQGQEYVRAAMRPAGSPSASRIGVSQLGGGQLGAEVDPEEEVLGDPDVDVALAGTEVRRFLRALRRPDPANVDR